MEIITKYYRNGRDVDADETMRETVRALSSGTVFTAEQLAQAVHSAYPNDEECGDLRFLRESASRLLGFTLSNSLFPASLRLCDEQGNGTYIRR